MWRSEACDRKGEKKGSRAMDIPECDGTNGISQKKKKK